MNWVTLDVMMRDKNTGSFFPSLALSVSLARLRLVPQGRDGGVEIGGRYGRNLYKAVTGRGGWVGGWGGVFLR